MSSVCVVTLVRVHANGLLTLVQPVFSVVWNVPPDVLVMSRMGPLLCSWLLSPWPTHVRGCSHCSHPGQHMLEAAVTALTLADTC